MKKKKKSKKVLIFLLIIVILVVVLWIVPAMGGDKLPMVETIQLKHGSIEELVNVSGMVESDKQKTYFSPVNANLMQVSVEAGDVVEAGTLLLAYDMDALEEELELSALQYALESNSYEGSVVENTDAEKKLAEARNNIAVLEQQIADEKTYIKNMYNALETLETNKSNENVARMMQLQNELVQLQEDPQTNAARIKEIQIALQNLQYESQIIATTGDAVELKKKIAEEEERLAGYEKYLAEMEAQKQEADMTAMTKYQKDNLSVTQQMNLLTYEKAVENYEIASKGIVAEFDGVVTECSAVEGMPVMEGVQLLTLASNEEVKVTFSVSKYDLERIAVGQSAAIELANSTYTGTVTKINKMAVQDMMGNYELNAEITIENPDENIYLGVDVKAEILSAKAENVLLLPLTALYADKTGEYVYVIEDNVVTRRNIVTGISSAEFIEVKEGLTSQDQVIVSLGNLEEGMLVTTGTN